MKNLVTAAPSMVAATIAGFISWLVATTNKKGARENALIDQLQEEVLRLNGVIEKKDQRIEEKDRKLQEVEEERHEVSLWALALQEHIIQQLPPPPPQRGALYPAPPTPPPSV